MNTTPRGGFSRQQVAQLLQPVEPFRVVTGAHVKPHLSQQDVVAHLIRVFGFGNFDIEVLSSDCIFEEPMTNSNNKPAWRVGYRALVRLTVRDEGGNLVASYDGGSTGESEGQPSRADSHDLAYKSSLSTATKRAAIHLGDQFGLSLYNKGQMQALVMGTMINTDWQNNQDIQAGVPQQEVDGGNVADRHDTDAEAPQEEAPSALPPARKRATKGTQGTKRAKPTEASQEAAAAPTEEPVKDEPAAPTPTPPAPAQEPPVAPVQSVEDDALNAERAERERMAAQQEQQVSDRERILATADEVDRDDEAAVKAWNAENGQFTGRFLTSTAELERQKAKAAADAEPEFVDTKTGDVYDTQAEMDAAIRARVQAKVTEDTVAAPGEPSALEVARTEEPTNFARHIAAATTDDELKNLWMELQKANQLTTELRAAIVNRKAQVEGND